MLSKSVATAQALLLVTTVLSGCSVSNTKEEPQINPSVPLLQAQEEQLADQSLRLESLATTQDEMLRYLNNVQVELSNLSQQLKQHSASGDAKVAAEADSRAPAQEKIIRQPREKPVAQGKAILGRVEYVWVEDSEVYLKARVDTGAKSSSLHAENIQRFERNGEKWVRFVIALDDQRIKMEAPVERSVKIRQAGMDELDRRPVVKLTIQLGELKEETEFTLDDRSEMLYPLLLGRSFLQDIALVDVAKKFTRKRDPKLKAVAETK